jgi:hypothetical protein
LCGTNAGPPVLAPGTGAAGSFLGDGDTEYYASVSA